MVITNGKVPEDKTISPEEKTVIGEDGKIKVVDGEKLTKNYFAVKIHSLVAIGGVPGGGVIYGWDDKFIPLNISYQSKVPQDELMVPIIGKIGENNFYKTVWSEDLEYKLQGQIVDKEN